MAIVSKADVIRGEKGAFDLPSWLAGLPNEEFAAAAVAVAGTPWRAIRIDIERAKEQSPFPALSCWLARGLAAYFSCRYLAK